MGELVTEATVEVFSGGKWTPVYVNEVPLAVEDGRAWRRRDVERAAATNTQAMPVRVIDSAGVVVQQWGRP